MKPEYVILHHSATADSGTVSWGAIRRYHVQDHGWKDVGYHAGVELVGDHYEALLGRGWDEEGAHTPEAGMNGRSVGICLVGNFDEAPPLEAQWEKALWLVRWIQRLVGIPAANVIGHREAGLMAGKDWTKGEYKTCPGRLFPMAEFRGALAG